MKTQSRSVFFWIGVILLVVPGLVYTYLLMSSSGNQNLNAINVAYYLEKIILPLGIAGGILITWYLVKYLSKNSKTNKISMLIILALCFCSFYLTDIMFKAETRFGESQTIKFAPSIYNKVPENFVIIGIMHNGIAKAYPLVYLGYHRKVEDSVGDEPVLVTYNAMDSTGRVYSPLINGMQQSFRLIGTRNYNAVIEDEGTKTWWYEATGAAVAGKLKGYQLQSIRFQQSTLEAWIIRHPGTLILQTDTNYSSNNNLTLKNKDSLKVVALIINGQAKAYDWQQLRKAHVVNDHIDQTPLLVDIEKDSLTFHAFNRIVKGRALHFKIDTAGCITDQETASVWDWNGEATSGTLKGSKLGKVQAYQEYQQSWKHFHPNTLFWKE